VAIDVVPELGGSIDTGVVVRWHCRVGDRVRRGDCLGEIETDKANVELGAPEDGIVEAIHVAEGAPFSAGAALLRIAPRDIGAAPSDLAKRSDAGRPARSATAPATERRCRFCHALQIAGRHDCPRCGAPL
jgi:pyruvate dehydrogenase E2 component (dihydrolipoamide acetyltransferase)